MHRYVAAVFASQLLFCTPLLAQPEPSPAEMREDAELTAVTFVNADRGWAVGDRGVIWHTADGGRSWKQQNSGVTCRLEAVQFLDADNGWAAGGWTQPYTHETHGIILRTRDGGKNWQTTPGLSLPGLTSIKLQGARWGWAIGNASPLFPSGVFFTDDGGKTWTPVMKGDTLGWASGDFPDRRGGVVAGLDGSISIVTTSGIRPAQTPNFGPRYIRRLLLAGTKPGPGDGSPLAPREENISRSEMPTLGWLIGDGGLVLSTSDGGLAWTAPAGALPESAAEFDFRAIAALGNRVWIAGAPGTCVLHSPDGGRSWSVFRTEQTVPLRSLCFIDEYRGWAVGSLGTILHTRDGGQTWRVQHSGGSRVGLLGIFSEPGRVPLELLAQQSGSEAYLSAIEILGRRDLEGGASSPDHFTVAARTHAATIAVGASQADTAWRFPLREAGLPQAPETILARWNQANEGHAAARLEAHLVRRIRQWRPEVIVTEDVSPRGDNPLAHITNQATLAAVQKAADADAYADQLAHLGLAPWTVKKVLTMLPGDKQGLMNVTPAQWSPRLGRSLADVAESGRGLILSDVAASRRNIGLSLLIDHLPQETGRREVMSGIALAPGSEARRQLSNPPAGDLEQLSRLAQKRHNVEQLLARIDGGGANVGNWLGQVDELTRGLPARHSGEIIWQLGQRYHQVGRSDSAAEAFHLLIDRHSQHPLADRAALWLVQYYASSEIAWRQRRQSGANLAITSPTEPAEATASVQPAAAIQAVSVAAPIEASFASMQRMGQVASAMTSAQRAGRAVALANQLQRTKPVLHANPALRFPLAVASRASSPLSPRGRGAGGEGGTLRSTDSNRLLQTLPQLSPTNPWSECLAAEDWLAHTRHSPPKKLLSVVTALTRPKLDGRLDEPLWQVAKPISLTTPTRSVSEGVTPSLPTQPPLTTVAVLAFDEEFLYLAVSCQKAPGLEYPTDDKPRVADEDFSQEDHVTLLLDLDRDYATYWQLSFDHRGRPAESCFGDSTWDPEWFIATGGDDQWWTAETAIPLAELSGKKPDVGDVWSAGIQRVIPRIGLQSFSHPAAIEIRSEGFGLLAFE